MRFLTLIAVALLTTTSFAFAAEEVSETVTEVTASATTSTQDAAASLNEIRPAAGAEVADTEGQDPFAERATPPSRRDLGQEVYFD